MNIVMFSNTYLPHVGGVAHSVASFTQAYRAAGHRVLVVAPTFENMPEREEDVLRVPAVRQFHGSDFSLRLPVPGLISSALHEFHPDILHAHHPFLLGSAALRAAGARNLPLVFTHHTMYERYTHYLPGDSAAVKRFASNLATQYANLCDLVFAPSESVRRILRRRGVARPIAVLPTGVDVERYASGDAHRARQRWGLPPEAAVIGHLGRLALEKNLSFLTAAVLQSLQRLPQAVFLVVGGGPAQQHMQQMIAHAGLSGRAFFTGPLQNQDLYDALATMDVFAFASTSETQGLVLVEAMAAGVPAVVLSAPGAREVVRDGINGRAIRCRAADRQEAFAQALEWVLRLPMEQRRRLSDAARQRAEAFRQQRCAARALRAYTSLIKRHRRDHESRDGLWEQALGRMEAEWRLWLMRVEVAAEALSEPA